MIPVESHSHIPVRLESMNESTWVLNLSCVTHVGNRSFSPVHSNCTKVCTNRCESLCTFYLRIKSATLCFHHRVHNTLVRIVNFTAPIQCGVLILCAHEPSEDVLKGANVCDVNYVYVYGRLF